MKKIYTNSMRDMMKNKFKFISVLVVVILGSMFYIGFNATSDIEREYIDDYYNDTAFPDLWAYFSAADEGMLEKVNDVEGVETAALRYAYDFKCEKEDKESVLSMMSYNDAASIAKPYLVDGKLPSEAYEAALDKEYAEANSVEIGDEMTLWLGSSSVDFKVTGFIESSEYLIKLQDSLSDVPDYTRYGIGFFGEETISSEFGGSIPYNQIVIRLEDDADDEKVKESIEEALGKDLLYCATRDLTSSYSLYQAHIEQSRNLSYVGPFLFFVIAAVMMFITVSNMINSQRTQIGIMKALGYSRTMIYMHYFSSAAVVSVIGVVAGGIIGMLVVPDFMFMALDKQFDVPGLESSIRFGNILSPVVIMLLFAAAAVWLSCRKILKESAASSMRPAAPSKSGKLLLERCPSVWKRLSTEMRLVIRNIFFNKKRAILCMFGIAGSMAMVVMGIGLNDSVMDLIDIQFEDVIKCDAKAVINTLDTDDAISSGSGYEIQLPDGASSLRFTSALCKIGSGDDDFKASVVAFDGDNKDYYSVIDEDGHDISIEEDGVIISKRISKKYGYKKGDTITIKMVDPNCENVTFEAEVKNISTQYFTQEIYCTPDFLVKNGITPAMNNMYINIDENKITYDELKKDMTAENGISEIKPIKEMRENMDEYCEYMYVDTIIMAVVAFIISLAVISSISSINYSERKRSLATMKVLGYSHRRIFRMISMENVFITLAGAIIGIPGGAFLLKYVLEVESTDTCSFPYPSVTLNITIAFVMVIIFTIIANFTIWGKIKKLELVKTLKTVE